jgi:superfamily II DNA or RNA helicase
MSQEHPKYIYVVLDDKLRIPIQRLEELGADAAVIQALTIPNLAREEAKKQKVYGWKSMPEYIQMWDYEGQFLVAPRGFYLDFIEGMKEYSGVVVPRNNMTSHNVNFRFNDIRLKRWQVPQTQAILQFAQGIIKSPAGSGKTVMLLETMAHLQRKSLVIVNTKDIMWQWQERIEQHLGEDVEIGQIGDDIYKVTDHINIATIQTLHSRAEQLAKEGFFNDFGFVALDECHHATAETYKNIMNRFTAQYRIGVSATPDKTGDFTMARLVLGPIIHETKPNEVDILIKPRVVRVVTKFDFAFKGHKSQWQRSNYPQMLKALITDPERNELICRNIIMNEGHHQLVVSKRLEHLKSIEDILLDADFVDPVISLTGGENNDERKYAKKIAETSPCVILSTLADEAMDIPRLDRLHLIYPQRNAGLVTQQVGRVERIHPDKKDAEIYDYIDRDVGPLNKQAQVRRFEVYAPRGYEIYMQYNDE